MRILLSPHWKRVIASVPEAAIKNTANRVTQKPEPWLWMTGVGGRGAGRLGPLWGSEGGLSHAPPAAAAGGCQALASAWFPSTSAAVSRVFLPNVARSVFKFLSDKDKGH